MGTGHWWAGWVHTFQAPTQPAWWTKVEACWAAALWTAAAGFPALNAARYMMSASPTTTTSAEAGLRHPSAWTRVSQEQPYVLCESVWTKTLQWLAAFHWYEGCGSIMLGVTLDYSHLCPENGFWWVVSSSLLCHDLYMFINIFNTKSLTDTFSKPYIFFYKPVVFMMLFV